MMRPKALTTYDIADYCQVTPRTVSQWINEGKIKAYRTPGNHSRVTSEDFVAFLVVYGMPVPEEFKSFIPQKRKRILIVDDDRELVDAIKRVLLREKVYTLDVAYDGFEAGKKFSGVKPDLIILDLKMPGIDGFKLCAQIRKDPENKNIKILLISGIASQEEFNKVGVLGADEFLPKPFSNEDLKERIKGLLK